jgi:hypothetical protein
MAPERASEAAAKLGRSQRGTTESMPTPGHRRQIARVNAAEPLEMVEGPVAITRVQASGRIALTKILTEIGWD